MTDVIVTGLDLKLARVARFVKATDLAARMGTSPSAVSRIESRFAVDPAIAKKYRDALATFPAVTTAQEGPEAA